jgi:hypothetical protein
MKMTKLPHLNGSCVSLFLIRIIKTNDIVFYVRIYKRRYLFVFKTKKIRFDLNCLFTKPKFA